MRQGNFGHRDRDTGRMLREDWSLCYHKEGTTIIDGKPLEKRHEPDSASELSEGTNSANTLIFGLLASRTVRQNCVSQSIQFLILCYGSPSKLVHWLLFFTYEL